jgi:hypothetical protein
MPFPITELLLLAIPVNRFGMFHAVTRPVIRMADSPFSGAVAANIAVLRIGGNLLAVVFGSALSLACQLAADRLAGLKLRKLKGLLAIAAAPFRHTAVVASPAWGTGGVRHPADLETAVECVPRPRQCHPGEQLQNRGNCGCPKPVLTDCLSRKPITVLQPASITPEPTKRC